MLNDTQQVTLYNSALGPSVLPEGTSVEVPGLDKPAVVHKKGMTFIGTDNKMVKQTNSAILTER